MTLKKQRPSEDSDRPARASSNASATSTTVSETAITGQAVHTYTVSRANVL